MNMEITSKCNDVKVLESAQKEHKIGAILETKWIKVIYNNSSVVSLQVSSMARIFDIYIYISKHYSIG